MSKLEEKTLLDALAFVGLKKLPQESDLDNYLSAIVLVEKFDGTKSYCIQKMGEDLKPYIAKDFGTISSITKVLSIHPYDFMKEKYVFKGTTKEEKLGYLKTIFRNGEYDFDTLSLKEINGLIKEVAVKHQREMEE